MPLRLPTLRTYSLLIAAAVLVAGCGRTARPSTAPSAPIVGLGATPKSTSSSSTTTQAPATGFSGFATKNTTRLGGADPVIDAAAAAQAVFPGGEKGNRAAAVALVDRHDWRTAIAASALMASPIDAPILFTDGTTVPPSTTQALGALQPRGSSAVGGAQAIRVGTVAYAGALKTTDIRGRDPYTLSRALDAYATAARGNTTDQVLIASADDPAYALPAAAWAAKSGDPVFFAHRASVPAETLAAIKAHASPRIYVLGPSKVIGPAVTKRLRALGTVVRVGGPDPTRNAIAFARFTDGHFGWGVVDPGHGMVIMNSAGDPATAGAVAPLSASGSYGPLLLMSGAGRVDPTLEQYLLDIRPGYTSDPVRGVYNRAWIVGDTTQIAAKAQAAIDALLEILPATNKSP